MQRHPSPTGRPDSNRGFTVPELLVATAVVFLLTTTLTIPLLDQREAARRQLCHANAKALGVAVHDYRVARGRFPINPDRNLVPFLATEEPVLEGRQQRLGSLRCPSDDLAWAKPYAFNYAWNIGPGFSGGGKGFLPDELCPSFTLADFPDGISQTAAASETLVFDIDSPENRRKLWVVSRRYPREGERHVRIEDRLQFQHECLHVPLDDDHESYSHRGTESGHEEWYNHLLTPNQPSCESGGMSQFICYTANSDHPGGVHLLLVDGSVRFISDTIDAEVWSALSTRAGSEMIKW